MLDRAFGVGGVRMRLMCMLGWHRWTVTRTESIRYGVLVTRSCTRCPARRAEARW